MSLAIFVVGMTHRREFGKHSFAINLPFVLFSQLTETFVGRLLVSAHEIVNNLPPLLGCNVQGGQLTFILSAPVRIGLGKSDSP